MESELKDLLLSEIKKALDAIISNPEKVEDFLKNMGEDVFQIYESIVNKKNQPPVAPPVAKVIESPKAEQSDSSKDVYAHASSSLKKVSKKLNIHPELMVIRDENEFALVNEFRNQVNEMHKNTVRNIVSKFKPNNTMKLSDIINKDDPPYVVAPTPAPVEEPLAPKKKFFGRK